MNESIDAKKLREFINNETTKALTPQDQMKKIQSLKLSVLEQAQEHLKKAFENNNTAMVAAIAEVLKTI